MTIRFISGIATFDVLFVNFFWTPNTTFRNVRLPSWLASPDSLVGGQPAEHIIYCPSLSWSAFGVSSFNKTRKLAAKWNSHGRPINNHTDHMMPIFFGATLWVFVSQKLWFRCSSGDAEAETLQLAVGLFDCTVKIWLLGRARQPAINLPFGDVSFWDPMVMLGMIYIGLP